MLLDSWPPYWMCCTRCLMGKKCVVPNWLAVVPGGFWVSLGEISNYDHSNMLAIKAITRRSANQLGDTCFSLAGGCQWVTDWSENLCDWDLGNPIDCNQPLETTHS